MQDKINKQETFEEAVENYINKFYSNYAFKELLIPVFIDAFKWQQEQDKKMYSEEEVINLLYERECKLNLYNHIFDYQDTKEWFEQFKKK
jgi:hypothetical protein